MAQTRRLASSFALLAALGGCVWQSDYQRDIDEREKKNAKLEQRIAELEQKGPMHDQKFYDRVIEEADKINQKTRTDAQELAAKNKTYLEGEVGRLTRDQQTSRDALQGTIAADGQRNQTARTQLRGQLQNLQDYLDEWKAIIGDPNKQDGIYGDRRRAQEEAERLTRAYALIGEINRSLTTFSDTRAAAQGNYEQFRAQTRPLFTQLGIYLADPTKSDAEKIDYINQTFIPRLTVEYAAEQERERARPRPQEARK